MARTTEKNYADSGAAGPCALDSILPDGHAILLDGNFFTKPFPLHAFSFLPCSDEGRNGKMEKVKKVARENFSPRLKEEKLWLVCNETKNETNPSSKLQSFKVSKCHWEVLSLGRQGNFASPNPRGVCSWGFV